MILPLKERDAVLKEMSVSEIQLDLDRTPEVKPAKDRTDVRRRRQRGTESTNMLIMDPGVQALVVMSQATPPLLNFNSVIVIMISEG